MDKAADVKIKQRVRKDRRKMHYDNDWLRGDKWQGFRKGKVRVRQDGEEAVWIVLWLSMVLGPPVVRRMSLIVLGSSLRCVLIFKTTITSCDRLVLKIDTD